LQVLLLRRRQELLEIGDSIQEKVVDRPIRGTDTQAGVEVAASQIQVNSNHRACLSAKLLGQAQGKIGRYNSLPHSTFTAGNGDGATLRRLHSPP